MLNSVFVDKSTGEQVRIVNEDVNFYVLDNSVSIKKEVFAKKYEAQVEVDPNSFFQTQYSSKDPLANLAQQLKNMDTSKIQDVPDSGARVKYIEKPVVLSDNSRPVQPTTQQSVEGEIQPTQLSPEERRLMMENFRQTMPGAKIPDIQNRNWEEEEDRLLNGDKPIKTEPKVDPIQMMFKMFKSNYPVKINIEITENIPNPTFIGMVQENVETDAVDYYAEIISNKILKDPFTLKTEIYKQLKSIINKELGIEEEKKEE